VSPKDIVGKHIMLEQSPGRWEKATVQSTSKDAFSRQTKHVVMMIDSGEVRTLKLARTGKEGERFLLLARFREVSLRFDDDIRNMQAMLAKVDARCEEKCSRLEVGDSDYSFTKKCITSKYEQKFLDMCNYCVARKTAVVLKTLSNDEIGCCVASWMEGTVASKELEAVMPRQYLHASILHNLPEMRQKTARTLTGHNGGVTVL